MKCFVLALLAAALLQPRLPAATSGTEPLGIALESYRYPYPVQFLPLQIQGVDVRMAYMDIPPRGRSNGRVAVLFHGKNFGGYYWANVIRMLTETGYRVIVPDQIGWGKSSKPEIRYSFQLLAANSVHLLETLGINRIVLVGHSTGGMLAVRFALTYPDRVSHLILEDPIGLEDYRLNVPPQSDETLYGAELQNIDPEKIRAFYSRYFAEPKPELYEPLAAVQIRVTLSAEYPRWAKASALAYQMIYQQPVRYEYYVLKPPTLIVVGDKDHAAPLSSYAPPKLRARMGHFPEMAEQPAKDIPRGSAIIIPNCGHIPHLEHPDKFKSAILDFLAAH